jgi:hypothetical protein
MRQHCGKIKGALGMNQNKMGQADTGAHQEDSKELAQYEEEKNCGKPEDTETEK